MSINHKLITFAQQELVLGYDNAERDRINASLMQLEKVLIAQLGNQIIEIIRFGSYTRNLILPRKYDPQSDVDLMVVFYTGNGRKTPGTYRKTLHDILEKAYPKSISKKDFPAVKLELNHIMFDIVPAYSERGYFSSNPKYLIPGPNDGWRETEPNDINGMLKEMNSYYGDGTLRNVIRLCKHWNATARYPFESYLMEKKIIDSFGWHLTRKDTYTGFVDTLKGIASGHSGVVQAVEYIDKYKGNWLTTPEENKQLQWLQKLLPGLK
jgi:predicted nucleotidyltransferase